MNIILFGGAFDPPHLGHILAAQTVLEKELADEVWFTPCYQHPFDKNMSPAKDRLAMLQLIKLPKTRICRYEIDQQSMSYSIDTLTHFAKAQPNDTFSWMIGSDNLSAFDTWHNYQQLLAKFQVIVYPRKGFPMIIHEHEMTFIHDAKEMSTSSTEVRQRIAAHQSIDDLTTPEIARYIEQHSLYNTSHD